jgi:hypothetical protein
MEKKVIKKTLPEAVKVYKQTQDNPMPDSADDIISIEDLESAKNTFKTTRETCVKCEEGIEGYKQVHYDVEQLTIDGNGNLTNSSGTISVPQTASDEFIFHSKIFLREMRKLFDITITPKQGISSACFAPFILPVMQVNHEEIVKQYAAGTLPVELQRFLDVQLMQLKACGVAYIPKKKGGSSQ